MALRDKLCFKSSWVTAPVQTSPLLWFPPHDCGKSLSPPHGHQCILCDKVSCPPNLWKPSLDLTNCQDSDIHLPNGWRADVTDNTPRAIMNLATHTFSHRQLGKLSLRKFNISKRFTSTGLRNLCRWSAHLCVPCRRWQVLPKFWRCGPCYHHSVPRSPLRSTRRKRWHIKRSLCIF